ncbi:helix-turn-helix transcriptional regulator [Vibrio metschnikovii]|nr:helix-turn-helix transcriptional regulator [Vibrio metschnikovii]
MSQELTKNADRLFDKEAIMRFPERLRVSIGDLSVRSFAQKCGLSESGLRKYISGETYPPLDKLISIAEAASVSFDWLCSGIDKDEVSKNFSDEFALIPGYSIQVSAGHGTNPIGRNEKPCRHLAFRRKWLKWRRFSDKDLAIVWAKGDSMEPTINNNDSLVVHLGRTVPQDGHLYIFRSGEELFVKRYQSALGSWRLISDNKVYDTLDIKKEEQHQFEVIGQVVHIAKDLGD